MRRAVSKILPTPKLFNELPINSSSTNSSSSIINNNSSKNSSSNLVSNFKLDFNAVDEFYTQLDDPHKIWLPGDEVSGQIVLVSKKNLANIIITLSLIGFIKINASSHSKLRPLKHTLFDHTIRIYGNDNEEQQEGGDNSEFNNGLFKGEHVFPFIVKLPNKRVFTSIDFGKGSINYILKGSVGNSSSYINAPTSEKKFIHNPSYTSEKLINLINPMDVSSLPKPKPKRLILRDPRTNQQNNRKLIRTQSSTSTINTINTFGTFSSNNSDTSTDDRSSSQLNIDDLNNHNNHSHNKPPATIKVILNVPQRGYLRGESIPVKLSINHLKKVQDLNGIIITFVRVCRLDNGPDGVVESFRKDLQQVVLPLYVDPITFQSEIQSSLRVPADSFPTITGCPLVSFQYFIEVLINLSGKSIIVDPEAITDRHSPDSQQQDQQHQITSIENFQFNFNSSLQHQKDRSNFINTDRFKRSKKFLQLTSEIYIGTHRSKLEIEDDRMSGRSSSSISNSNNVSPAIFTNSPIANNNNNNHNSITTSPINHNSTSPSNISANSPSRIIPTIPESSQLQIPPYNDVPTYNNQINNFNNNNNNEPLSEKEQMAQYHESLLPSAPPEEDGDVEDNHDLNQKHGINIHNDHHNHQHQDFPPPPLSESSSSQQPLPPPPTNQHQVPTSHQFNFFTYENNNHPTSSNHDIFYQSNHNSNYHNHQNSNHQQINSNNSSNLVNEIFNDEIIDNVPNYMTVENDQLLSISHSNPNQLNSSSSIPLNSQSHDEDQSYYHDHRSHTTNHNHHHHPLQNVTNGIDDDQQD
ncbi:RIM8 [Candida pseudojiufengensis]|uniref:RIM8 n=1 Tax=Candida pseudojiufengensis TaxID=497109 RepID=UPI00222554E7|nr:RIM8 [Candida pseudojiufengensis]KAI5966310.1 RIM8 [Candida pseudojiufengensis]